MRALTPSGHAGGVQAAILQMRDGLCPALTRIGPTDGGRLAPLSPTAD